MSNILSTLLKDKKYIGYDINIFAILIANILNILKKSSNKSFYFGNALNSADEKCELFVSVGTLIYFSKSELNKFINKLKKNNVFKEIIMHEIFLNEEQDHRKTSFKDDTLNIHSISKIKAIFGEGYEYDLIRTYYSNWEKKDRISAIFKIRKSNKVLNI